MHQSERPSTMDVMRLRPLPGTHSTLSIAASAAPRNPSTDTNHCPRRGHGSCQPERRAREHTSATPPMEGMRAGRQCVSARCRAPTPRSRSPPAQRPGTPPPTQATARAGNTGHVSPCGMLGSTQV